MLTRPAEIVFHNLDASHSVENLALDMISKLERLSPSTTSVRVVIEVPNRSERRPRYAVTIEMVQSGHQLMLQHIDLSEAGYDVYHAVRDGFVRAMRLAVEHAQSRVLHV